MAIYTSPCGDTLAPDPRTAEKLYRVCASVVHLEAPWDSLTTEQQKAWLGAAEELCFDPGDGCFKADP